MLKFETEAEQKFRDTRRKLECCLETGNFEEARTALKEYEAINPDGGRTLRAFVAKEYGTAL